MTPRARSARRGSATRRVAVALAALASGVALLLGTAGPAAAHAELVTTDPEEGAVVEVAPEVVTLTFDETVRLTSQEIAVYDAAGEEVASSAGATGAEVTVRLPGASDLADGTYVVSWNVLSSDGHPIAGALTFSVGAPSASVVAPPEPETSSVVVVAVRDALTALTLVGLLTAAGLALFVALVLPTSWSGRQTRARLRRVLTWSAVGAVAGAVLGVPVASAYAQGLELDGALTSFSPGLVVNEVLAVLLVALGLGLVVRAASTTPDAPGTTARRFLVAGALVALVAPSLAGHSRSFPPVGLLVAADVLHVVAGAIWLGGLVGLAVSLVALAGREVLAAQTLARFSTLAGGLLLLVAATGTFLGWRILGSWSALVGSTYGWLLLAKVAVALVVAAVGGWNRWRTLPTVRAAAGFGDRDRAARLVTRTVRVEAVLLVVVLALTGVLTSTSPRPAPVTAESGTTGTGAASAGDLRVLAVLDPQRTGSTSLLVQVQDAAGEPYDAPTNPTVSLRTPGLDIGEVQMTPIGAGTYRGEVVLPRPGEWEVQVSLLLSRFESPVTTIRLTVPR